MRDRDFAEVERQLRESLSRQGFLHHVGATIDEVARGRVVLSVKKRLELLQQYGLFHGGVIGFLVDNAATAAAGTVIDRERQQVITAEYKVNMLAPATGDSLRCVGTVLKPGKTLTISEARVFSVSTGDDKLVAVGLATIVNLDISRSSSTVQG